MAVCEDAPCCGCCGTNIYGVYQGEGGPYDGEDFDAYDDRDDYFEDDEDGY